MASSKPFSWVILVLSVLSVPLGVSAEDVDVAAKCADFVSSSENHNAGPTAFAECVHATTHADGTSWRALSTATTLSLFETCVVNDTFGPIFFTAGEYHVDGKNAPLCDLSGYHPLTFVRMVTSNCTGMFTLRNNTLDVRTAYFDRIDFTNCTIPQLYNCTVQITDSTIAQSVISSSRSDWVIAGANVTASSLEFTGIVPNAIVIQSFAGGERLRFPSTANAVVQHAPDVRRVEVIGAVSPSATVVIRNATSLNRISFSPNATRGTIIILPDSVRFAASRPRCKNAYLDQTAALASECLATPGAPLREEPNCVRITQRCSNDSEIVRDDCWIANATSTLFVNVTTSAFDCALDENELVRLSSLRIVRWNANFSIPSRIVSIVSLVIDTVDPSVRRIDLSSQVTRDVYINSSNLLELVTRENVDVRVGGNGTQVTVNPTVNYSLVFDAPTPLRDALDACIVSVRTGAFPDRYFRDYTRVDVFQGNETLIGVAAARNLFTSTLRFDSVFYTINDTDYIESADGTHALFSYVLYNDTTQFWIVGHASAESSIDGLYNFKTIDFHVTEDPRWSNYTYSRRVYDVFERNAKRCTSSVASKGLLGSANTTHLPFGVIQAPQFPDVTTSTAAFHCATFLTTRHNGTMIKGVFEAIPSILDATMYFPPTNLSFYGIIRNGKVKIVHSPLTRVLDEPYLGTNTGLSAILRQRAVRGATCNFRSINCPLTTTFSACMTQNVPWGQWNGPQWGDPTVVAWTFAAMVTKSCSLPTAPQSNTVFYPFPRTLDARSVVISNSTQSPIGVDTPTGYVRSEADRLGIALTMAIGAVISVLMAFLSGFKVLSFQKNFESTYVAAYTINAAFFAISLIVLTI